MNYEADLMSRKTVDLRKEGARLEIPGASKGKKADLVVAIAAKYAQAEIDRAKAAKAAKAAPAKGKLCIACNTRKGMSSAARGRHGVGADFADQCEACYIEGGWENTHSDDGHDVEITETSADGNVEIATGRTSKGDNCWICHPELMAEFIAANYRTGVTGSTRVGMTMNTKNGQTGEDKAKVVAEALKHLNLATTVEKGQVFLAGDDGGTFTFEMVWDLRGRYQYGPSTFTAKGKTRKIRNVAELLRLVG